MLEIIHQGYSLEFQSTPPRGSLRLTPGGPRDGPIRQEVRQLLKKNAIEVVPAREGGGFYSRFFLRPKKSGGSRPILNLRPLNKHLVKRYFKMDHFATIRPHLKRGWFAVSIDLSDAYLHIPVKASHRKFLRFALSPTERYQFLCLCFGLRTAPRVFTKVAAEIGAFMHKLGVYMFQYLDDWLLIHPVEAVLKEQLAMLIQTVEKLGFLINWQKSDLEPSRHFTYLGVLFNLHKGLAFPSKDRLDRLEEAISSIQSNHGGQVGMWLHMLGIMASCIEIVPWARLRMRPIQMFLLAK